MKQFYLFVFLTGMIMLSRTAMGQDVHLSHIHASPTFLNPAMVGLMNEDLRLIETIAVNGKPSTQDTVP